MTIITARKARHALGNRKSRKQERYWIVPNATTGALMLAGPSTGIIAGTATGIGAVASALLSPVAIVAGVAVLGAGATCYMLQ